MGAACINTFAFGASPRFPFLATAQPTISQKKSLPQINKVPTDWTQ